jgi:hypothetical protein
VDGDWWGVFPFVPCGGANNPYDCDDFNWTYPDDDGDGFGSIIETACGTVYNNDDCNDNELRWIDNDGDGFGGGTYVACGGASNNSDCDDNLVTYSDNDNDGFGALPKVACGGLTDYSDCDDNQVLYTDNDGDGFGAEPPVPCSSANNNVDCDDNAWTFRDVDNDGYGDSFGFLDACGAYNTDDCNDNDANINPGVAEYLCDGIDNNCSGQIDEGNTVTIDAGPNKIVYIGYPDSSCTKLQSTAPSGGVAPYTRLWSTGNTASFINVCPTSTTVYYLTVTDSRGCSFTDSVKVCVFDVRCGSSLTNVIVCHGTGSASNPFVTICTDLAGAKYHLKKHPGEKLGTCGMNKSCLFPVETRLDNSEAYNTDDNYFNVFPNPLQENATVRFKLMLDGIADIRLFDMTGRELLKMYDEEAAAGSVYDLTFDASMYAKGMYFLTLKTSSGEMMMKKLMISK